MTEHIDPADALSLAALSEDDSELVEARAHARQCAQCRTLLAESQAMLQLLDASQLPTLVEPALKARIERKLYGRAWGWPQLLTLGTAVVSFLLVLTSGQVGGLASLSSLAQGAHCAGYEAIYAAAPLALGAALTRMGKLRLQPLPFAGVTMACAVVGQLVLRTRCPVHGLTLHLFVFHFLAVLALGLIAAGSVRILDPDSSRAP